MALKRMNADFSRVFASIKKKRLLMEVDVEDLQEATREVVIPTSAFSERLGMLEAAVLYLKESRNLNFKEIAIHLKRDYKTIWTSYRKAKEKVSHGKK